MNFQDPSGKGSESPGLTRFIAPWLFVAVVAVLTNWHGFLQAFIALLGIALVRHLAVHWPLFATLSAPAVAVYGWSAWTYMAGGGGQRGMVMYFVYLAYFGVLLIAVLQTFGRSMTAFLDTVVRRTRAPSPWLKQAVLGAVVCGLSFLFFTRAAEVREARRSTAEAAHDRPPAQALTAGTKFRSCRPVGSVLACA